MTQKFPSGFYRFRSNNPGIIIKSYLQSGLKKIDFCKQFHISTNTLNKLLKKYEFSNEIPSYKKKGIIYQYENLHPDYKETFLKEKKISIKTLAKWKKDFFIYKNTKGYKRVVDVID